MELTRNDYDMDRSQFVLARSAGWRVPDLGATTMTAGAPRGATFGAQTAARAFYVLQAIVESDRPLTLTELAAKVGLNKSVTYRLTREMEEQRLITTNQDRAYVPASGLFALAARVMSRLDVRQFARPYLLRMSELTGETIALHLRHGQNRVCVDLVESIHTLRRFMALGESFPLYVGPSGKTILAFLPGFEAEALLRIAGENGYDRARIEAQLASIREKGYMAAIGDQNAGVGGLTVPVFGPAGIAGCITISGPAERWSIEAMNEVADQVAALARDCSRALGADAHLPVPPVL